MSNVLTQLMGPACAALPEGLGPATAGAHMVPPPKIAARLRAPFWVPPELISRSSFPKRLQKNG